MTNPPVYDWCDIEGRVNVYSKHLGGGNLALCLGHRAEMHLTPRGRNRFGVVEIHSRYGFVKRVKLELHVLLTYNLLITRHNRKQCIEILFKMFNTLQCS